jgi:hypothetical protein
MTKADLICWLGSVVIGGGLYIIHPAAACLWGGAVLLAVGVLLQKKSRKDNPQ